MTPLPEEARALLAEVEGGPNYVSRVVQAAYALGVKTERKRAATIVDAEEELDGAPPDDVEHILRNGMYRQKVNLLRATVRATKRSIAAAIRGDDL